MVHTRYLDRDSRNMIKSLYLSGLSAKQISEKAEISIHAVFYALRKLNVPRRSPAESNYLRFSQKQPSFLIREHLTPEQEQLKIAAVMLYWAEGYKAGKSGLDFANSDPNMVLLFRKFLSEICGVDESRIRCVLYCHENQDPDDLMMFWSKLLHIPLTQFSKPYIKRSGREIRTNRMENGLVHIRYYDTKLLWQMRTWISMYAESCVGGGVVNRT